jgi:hypothetical protein
VEKWEASNTPRYAALIHHAVTNFREAATATAPSYAAIQAAMLMIGTELCVADRHCHGAMLRTPIPTRLVMLQSDSGTLHIHARGRSLFLF